MNFLKNLCPICGSLTAVFLEPCQECRTDILTGTGTPCSICASDLAGSDNPCPDCRSESHILDDLTPLGPWCGKLRELVSAIKYGGDSRLAGWISGELTRIWQNKWPGIILVPVPPRPARIFRTGIDPVGNITQGMGQRGVPVAKLLQRKGNQTQKTLNREDRKLAVNLDYRLKKGRYVIEDEYVLFDDISTTGTTLEICAQILKDAGAGTVHGLIICKD